MKLGVHWFRNDLRLRDNTALAEVCAAADRLVALFVLDERLIAGEHAGAPRVRFLLDCLGRLASDLEKRGHTLVIRRGDPTQIVPRFVEEARAEILSYNRDTTPYARERDEAIRSAAEAAGCRVIECKDRVLLESSEVPTRSGGVYTVYTPYRRAWMQVVREARIAPSPAPRLPAPGPTLPGESLPDARALGCAEHVELPEGGEGAALERLDHFLESAAGRYDELRDFPGVDGTSRLSPYLRLGAISARECVYRALEAGEADPELSRGTSKWVDELVWREFYAGILETHPHVLRGAFRPQYDAVRWNDDEEGFRAWCEGRTGYPIVDAGMRQLLRTGWMHNRARMLTASFLVKDLLVDWRRGERFFFERLVDGDPASNNGGWQWTASTGTDAAPYFRIFNPVTQGKRFDSDGRYVRTWVPELRDVPDRYVHEPWKAPEPPRSYPAPIVSHAERRLVALERYGEALAVPASRFAS